MKKKNQGRIYIRLMIWVVLIVIIWFFVVSFFAYYNATHPRQTDYSLTPDGFNTLFEDVEFRTEDDLRLTGWFIESIQEPKGTVIVMHGYPGNKSDILNMSLFLKENYNVLLFDFRYFGSSDGQYTTLGWNEKKDLKAALDYLAEREDVDEEKIGVLGFSMGGAVAIMQGSEDDRIKAIVSDSSYASLDLMVENMFTKFGILKKPMIWSLEQWASWRIGVKPENVSVVQAAARNEIPLLIIHGTTDQQVPIDHARMIFQAAKGSSELWEVDGSDHGEAYFNEKLLYEAKVNAFFETNFEKSLE